ncbi:aspartate carbamoyltransferase [Kytococcus aerolatus]|uniref:Aspartate carbamoyltransferase n=1 Tax=Kytococcus aerolatus TaxID=592308 RepID=A0A212T083_9MICO|nr:aspartate carbamoyltransferase catalytic subunit [Kytococcus aerolatus]SNC59266.1 aspartate carbamoyltransferase [Kytococcus aerolatus]
MKHLLGLAGLSAGTLVEILDAAERFAPLRTERVKKRDELRGRTVINLFFEDSTRTRSSFEIAGKWLGADTINIAAKGSSVSKGESLRDTTATIAAMGVDAIVMRHPASGAPHQVARWLDEAGTGVSVLNAGDGTHEHPTQALLDALTLRRELGSLQGAHVAIVGDVTHSRVFRSNVIALRALGARVTVVAPPTLLPSGVRSWSQAEGFEIADDLDVVLPTVDAAMMLRVQAERMAGGFFPTPREYTIGYGLTRDRLALLPDHAAICHPGPLNRGLEIATEAADDARSRVLDQVGAGVAVRMAVLDLLLNGENS